jgi:hypothetical protein
VQRRYRANPSPADHTKSLRAGVNSKIYAHPGFDLRLLAAETARTRYRRSLQSHGPAFYRVRNGTECQIPARVDFEEVGRPVADQQSLYALMRLVAEAYTTFPGHQLRSVPLVRVHAAGSGSPWRACILWPCQSVTSPRGRCALWSLLHERTATVPGLRMGAESRLALFGCERGSPNIHLDRCASP